jgi:hypothetical protein
MRPVSRHPLGRGGAIPGQETLGGGECEGFGRALVKTLEQTRVRRTVSKLLFRGVDSHPRDDCTHARKQRPKPMVDGEQVAGGSTSGDRHTDLADEGVRQQQVEENLEEATVGGAVNRSTRDHDPRVDNGVERRLNRSNWSSAEQSVGRQQCQIDQRRFDPARGEPRKCVREESAGSRPLPGGAAGNPDCRDTACRQRSSPQE